jgi:hypothetical protein
MLPRVFLTLWLGRKSQVFYPRFAHRDKLSSNVLLSRSCLLRSRSSPRFGVFIMLVGNYKKLKKCGSRTSDFDTLIWPPFDALNWPPY